MYELYERYHSDIHFAYIFFLFVIDLFLLFITLIIETVYTHSLLGLYMDLNNEISFSFELTLFQFFISSKLETWNMLGIFAIGLNLILNR